MTLVRLAPLLLAACVIHADENPFDGNNKDLSEAALMVQPEEVTQPGTATLTISDQNLPSADFYDVYDLRALGDFEILEWSAAEDHLSVVVDVYQGAQGEQPIGIDSNSGTVYVSFQAL